MKIKKERQVLLSFSLTQITRSNFLIQVEIHLDVHGHGYRLSIFLVGLKQPGPYLLERFLIQAHAQAADDPEITRLSIRPDNRREGYHALILRLAGFFRVIRKIGRASCRERV